LEPVPQTQLGEDVPEVGPDGGPREEQTVGDLGIRRTGGHLQEHGSLALGEVRLGVADGSDEPLVLCLGKQVGMALGGKQPKRKRMHGGSPDRETS
jgi:hypothetical protein